MVRVTRPVAWASLALALAVAAAPAVAGQVFVDLDTRNLSLKAGETTITNVTIANPTNVSYVVQAKAAGNLSDVTEIEPKRFNLGRQAERNVVVSISPGEHSDFLEGDMRLVFQFIDRETGEATQRTERISLTMTPPLLYLGTFENPLPPRYDDANWLFGLEMATWLLVAAGLAAVTRFVTNRLVPRATDEVQAEMAGKMRWPISVLPVVLGGRLAWRLLPRRPATEAFGTLIEALAVVAVALVVYRIVAAALVYYRERAAGHRTGRAEGVLVPVLEKLSAAAVITLAGFFLLRTLEVDISFLVGGGIVAGLVISMAAQDTLANFFSGLHILLDQPFREGDVLQLDSGEICRVERIGLRSTKLYHFQNHQEIIAPNNDLASQRVINLSYPDSQYRIGVSFGVSYDTDLEEVRHLVHNIAMDVDEVIKGRNTQPRVWVSEFGDSSINLELRAFVPNERDRLPASTKIIQRIHETFDEEGIEIPFPQRVLHMQPPEQDGAREEALEIDLEAPDEADGEG